MKLLLCSLVWFHTILYYTVGFSVMLYIISLVSYFVPYYMGIRHLMISYTPEVCTVLAENILWYYNFGTIKLLREGDFTDSGSSQAKSIFKSTELSAARRGRLEIGLSRT